METVIAWRELVTLEKKGTSGVDFEFLQKISKDLCEGKGVYTRSG